MSVKYIVFLAGVIFAFYINQASCAEVDVRAAADIMQTNCTAADGITPPVCDTLKTDLSEATDDTTCDAYKTFGECLIANCTMTEALWTVLVDSRGPCAELSTTASTTTITTPITTTPTTTTTTTAAPTTTTATTTKPTSTTTATTTTTTKPTTTTATTTTQDPLEVIRNYVSTAVIPNCTLKVETSDCTTEADTVKAGTSTVMACNATEPLFKCLSKKCNESADLNTAVAKIKELCGAANMLKVKKILIVIACTMVFRIKSN
ncbi:integumentary mucin C.1-like isoform X2 [Physella acuta]|uniref:integumentary mucin C.1-like isoform X2 n=1 Tax=Physella acuta TaxID=109671 RepID=UPI0027DBB476|nr:integumentary mucin C.1-like isoform X2 [Physella acuta]